MEGLTVVEASAEMAERVARFCLRTEQRDDPHFIRGAQAKEAWIRERAARGEPVGKLALLAGELMGILHYETVPEEGVAHIRCIYVPHREHWGKGIGSALLSSLLAEMREPQLWNGGRPALGITTQPFGGHAPGQLPAREFFLRRGFDPTPEDPGLLFRPLEPGARYVPRRSGPTYVPQPEDRGRAVILHGPSFCPWSYPFHARAAEIISELAPGLAIRWIDRAAEPEEFFRRGGYEGIIVNGRPIRAFVLDRAAFVDEVRAALG